VIRDSKEYPIIQTIHRPVSRWDSFFEVQRLEQNVLLRSPL